MEATFFHLMSIIYRQQILHQSQNFQCNLHIGLRNGLDLTPWVWGEICTFASIFSEFFKSEFS